MRDDAGFRASEARVADSAVDQRGTLGVEDALGPSPFIRTLFTTFPDAKVIWTHRDPYATFASSISMRGKSRPIFNKDADVGYMRERFPMQMALHVMRPLQMSRERPNDIYNLYYDDLLADPIAQMKKVYAWLGDSVDRRGGDGHAGMVKGKPAGALRSPQLFAF